MGGGLLASVEQLYVQYHRAVYAYLYRMTGSRELAEDLLQETFYRAVRKSSQFRGDSSPLTWLHAIAYRAYLNEVRTRRRRPLPTGVPLPDSPANPSDSPEASALRRADRSLIEATFQLLPENQRLALTLRDVDGFTYEEIAGILGLTLASVKVTIHRARVRFRVLYTREE